MRYPFGIPLLAFVATIASSTVAFPQSFTDDPLTPGVSVKAEHITQLRDAVANRRALLGLAVFTFTDSGPTPAVTPIRAIHILDLRNALNEVFDAVGRPHPTYADGSPAGIQIKAVHIQELRDAVRSLPSVAACAGSPPSLINGATHCGAISSAGQTDVWTFSATAGERIAVHIGEVTDQNDFRPWIRVQAPNSVELGNTSGVAAAALNNVVATVTGTYVVRVASFDSGLDGTGTYRLTMTKTPGPIAVSVGDEGGPLTNGGLHTGQITVGDLDVWTFTANVGERIAVHAGEITDASDFRPWIRLWAPNGVSMGDTSGVGAAALNNAVAPVTGTYLVLVASLGPSGLDGAGTYRLTVTHTTGAITVTDGDQGGPIENGAVYTGEITTGDLDVWAFTATAGDLIAVHLGEITDTADFHPWIRLWAPNAVSLGDTTGAAAAAINNAIAPVTGTYLVLVASLGPSGLDGAGTYRLTMTHTPGPITVTAGDQGGPFDNGALHTGEITTGDLDVWTFTASAGDRIAVHIGEITDTSDFRPWIRMWAPNGSSLGDTSGVDATAINNAIAPVTGMYLVLVASLGPSGLDGAGTYRLTMTHTPGPITVTDGDQGGALTNGGSQAGEILRGDLDVWTITVPAGNRVTVNLSETIDNNDFRPWIRLWAPNGASLGDTSGLTSAAIVNAVAPVSGTYLVLVGSFNSGLNGTGTYQLTVTHVLPP